MKKDEILKKIIEMVRLNYTIEQMCKSLGITYDELYLYMNILRLKGFTFKSRYYEDGSISYLAISREDTLATEKKRDYAKIITRNGSDTLRAVVISDIHFGNVNEDLVATYEIFNYAAGNNIHVIFNTGDFIDGTFGSDPKKIDNIYDQIAYFLDNYPHDDAIITFGVGGDHDYSTFRIHGQDFIKAVSNCREDIVIPCYASTNIFVKEDSIILEHHIDNVTNEISQRSVVLHGHYHEYAANVNPNNILHVKVPSLSQVGGNIPTALDITFEFNNGYINGAIIKQLVLINGKFISIGETHFNKFGILNGYCHDTTQGNYTGTLPSERTR